MKRNLLLLSSTFLLIFHAFGQKPESLPAINSTATSIIQNKQHSLASRAPVNCGVDTVYYTLARTTQAESKVLFSNGTYVSRAAQWYPANTTVPIQIRGFQWFGYSFDPTNTQNIQIPVICELYAAGSDSLPTGSALASVTINIDTVSANAERNAIFSTPVSLTGPYVLVLTNTTSNILFYGANDEDAGDGGGESLSSSYYEPAGYWRKNTKLWAQGNYDNLFFPFTQFAIDANFTMNTTGCVGQAVTMTNTSTGYFGNRFYNAAVAAGNPISYHWNYGDGATDAYQNNGSRTYTSAGTYVVELRDTLFGWTITCTDNRTRNITISVIPPAPSASPPAPVCEGTPIGNLTATGTGGTMTWWSNPAPSGQLGTGNPYSSTISAPTTVYVTETIGGCRSTPTSVALAFIAAPQPTITTTPQGGLSMGYSTTAIADSYTWDFGDGSPTQTGTTASHTFSTAGPHQVCLTVLYPNGCSRTFCQATSFVSIEDTDLKTANVFPNPTVDLLHVSLPSHIATAHFNLMDLSGKTVVQGTISNSSNYISVGELARGVYLLKLYHLSNSRTFKVVLR